MKHKSSEHLEPDNLLIRFNNIIEGFVADQTKRNYLIRLITRTDVFSIGRDPEVRIVRGSKVTPNTFAMWITRSLLSAYTAREGIAKTK